MKRSPELKPNIRDAAVVLLVFAAAVVCALTVWGSGRGDAGELTVTVSVDGQEVDRFLPEELLAGVKTYANNGYTLTVAAAVKNASAVSSVQTDMAGGICVAAADCPTQDCVHTGVIIRAGQSIVCLPARIVIELVGGEADENAVDAVIG